jgi:hypothetical protein
MPFDYKRSKYIEIFYMDENDQIQSKRLRMYYTYKYFHAYYGKLKPYEKGYQEALLSNQMRQVKEKEYTREICPSDYQRYVARCWHRRNELPPYDRIISTWLESRVELS